MTSKIESITYSVLVRDKAGWNSRASVGDMQSALQKAEQLFASKKFFEVKVDKKFFDPTHKRDVNVTILEKTRNSVGFPVLPLIIAMIVLGGVVSFAVTYFIARQMM